jgi:hypothetical protein
MHSTRRTDKRDPSKRCFWRIYAKTPYNSLNDIKNPEVSACVREGVYYLLCAQFKTNLIAVYFSLNQLYYINNLGELSYMFRLT